MFLLYQFFYHFIASKAVETALLHLVWKTGIFTIVFTLLSDLKIVLNMASYIIEKKKEKFF